PRSAQRGASIPKAMRNSSLLRRITSGSWVTRAARGAASAAAASVGASSEATSAAATRLTVSFMVQTSSLRKLKFRPARIHFLADPGPDRTGSTPARTIKARSIPAPRRALERLGPVAVLRGGARRPARAPARCIGSSGHARVAAARAPAQGDELRAAPLEGEEGTVANEHGEGRCHIYKNELHDTPPATQPLDIRLSSGERRHSPRPRQRAARIGRRATYRKGGIAKPRGTAGRSARHGFLRHPFRRIRALPVDSGVGLYDQRGLYGRGSGEGRLWRRASTREHPRRGVEKK